MKNKLKEWKRELTKMGSYYIWLKHSVLVIFNDQSEHIIGPGSHIEYPTGTKNSNFVEDHPRSIPAKFGSNRPSDFGEEAWNVKSLQTTDNRRRTTDDIDVECKLKTCSACQDLHALQFWSKSDYPSRSYCPFFIIF
jgi:hypothetical protein